MNDHTHNPYSAAFFIVPSYIIDLPGMTLGYLKVYETIFQFWNHNKLCFLSEEAICERTGLGRTTVYEALTYFESHNELIRRRKGGKRYLVRPERALQTDCSNSIPTSAPADCNVRSSGRTTSAPADYNKKNRTKEDKKTTTVPTDPSSSSFFSSKEILILLGFMLESDPRSKEVFLSHCQWHIQHPKVKMSRIQHMAGLKTILLKCVEAGEHFHATGMELVKKKETAEEFRARQEEWRLAQRKKSGLED